MAALPHKCDRLRGLREQIFANAAVVFPKAVAAHLDYHRINFAPPEDIFDVIITQRRNNGLKAILIYGRVLDPRMVAASTEGHQVPEVVLEALLVTVSQALEKSKFSVIGSARAVNTLDGGKIEVELM